MRLNILVAIYMIIFFVGLLFASYNKGFNDAYVLGLVAQGLGLDSFENYDMPYTNVDNHKKKW
jgi:hypothetical protein